MVKLDWVDHAADPGAWAKALGVSREAVDLLIDSAFIDLHLDLEVPVRLLGYDPTRRHGPWRRVVPFMGHTDYPRLREARFTGVVYDLATNVFRREASRQAITHANVARCIRQIDACADDLGVARSYDDYQAITASGRTAMFLALQGGNALSLDPTALNGPIGRDLHRITLVHLKSSVLGGSNSPGQPDAGVTARGREFISLCEQNQVIVDLAHAGRRTFWSAVEASSPSIPLIVSHTGMAGVRPLWRNTYDDQARAVAERGGVVGIVYQGNFLTKVRPGCACPRAAILDHMEHLIRVAGEASAAIGTDYDGVITPPSDLCDVTDHALLVQDMLDRGWSEARIRGVLGDNYLAVVRSVRPHTPAPRVG